MSKRAERRHHRARMVARAKIILNRMGFSEEGRAQRWADNLKKCSCSMCCNKRRGWENPPTFQEIQNKLDLEEALKGN